VRGDDREGGVDREKKVRKCDGELRQLKVSVSFEWNMTKMSWAK
jgi:hypothetical protein